MIKQLNKVTMLKSSNEMLTWAGVTFYRIWGSLGEGVVGGARTAVRKGHRSSAREGEGEARSDVRMGHHRNNDHSGPGNMKQWISLLLSFSNTNGLVSNEGKRKIIVHWFTTKFRPAPE